MFSAEMRGEFGALRGKKVVEFLNGCYDYGRDVGTKPNIAYLDLPGFPYTL